MNFQKLLIMMLPFLCTGSLAQTTLGWRGVVYDVGLKFTPESCSVDTFDAALVEYDMGVIAHTLHANAVRIEGEDIDRLKAATEIAHAAGLTVFFNPWKMNVGAGETVAYMTEAAKAAEELRCKGIDLVFVAGCEYSLFNEGVLPGNNIAERVNALMPPSDIQKREAYVEKAKESIAKLNQILSAVCHAVRSHFKGRVTYSSGTWETVNWEMFDLIGVDYYRDVQTDADYVAGIRRYQEQGKPVIVMEVGCCAYEGAAKRGGAGYAILQGTDAEGAPVYEGGVTPTRSEREQADYVRTQISLLQDSGIQGLFVYVFSFPISPYREQGFDPDMTSYSLVKTYPSDDARSRRMPPWAPKEAFHAVAEAFRRFDKE